MSDTINIGGIQVSKFYLGGSSDVKIYLGTTKLYPHLQEPCFAVVDNISTYTARTYVDVYETSSDKWYKLNNLGNYEEYGVYGSSTATTYYDGKLVIQDGYEYQYSGSGWNNVGEISGSSRVPAGYSEVEYIENTGSSYINTTLQLCSATTNTFQVEAKLTPNRIGTQQYQNIFSCMSEAGEPYQGFTYRYQSSTIQGQFIPSNDGSFTQVSNSDGTTSVTASSVNGLTYSHTYPLTICCGLDSSRSPFRYTNTRIYTFKVTLNNSVVANYVPARRNSDSVYGLYDLITDTFLTSPNGNNFVGGSVVTGSSLPDVAFVLNYNAKDYDSSTTSIPYTEGQLNTVNAVKQYGAAVVDHSEDGYISVTGNTRFVTTGGTTSIARNNTQTGCTMTIVSKARTTSSQPILTSRGGTSSSQMNWMWRYPTDGIFLHGSSSYNTKKYSVDTTTSPIIASVKTYYDGGVKQTLKDWTNNGGYSGNFGYGSSYNGGSMFCDYLSYNSEFWKGDFYWVYMSQEVLTDEQIQQVIAYNESGGQAEYPVYYDEIQDPPNNLSFSSMTEAEEYECPWYGMSADIDSTDYMFCEGNEWLTKYTYIEVTGEYLCNNGNKYKKMQEYDRIPDGTTTAHTPATYVIGDLIESASTDCALPYTELQWIEMPQTSPYCAVQLADTYSTSTSLYYDFEILFNSLADTRIIGFASNSFLIGYNNNSIYLNINGGRAFTVNSQFTTNIKYHFGLGKRNSSSNNTFDNLGTSTTYATFGTLLPTTKKPYFGAINQGSTLYVNGESERIYSIKVYDNEVLVGNYIPVKRNSDNFVTLYDTVSEQFCDTVGGGTMVAGPTA